MLLTSRQTARLEKLALVLYAYVLEKSDPKGRTTYGMRTGTDLSAEDMDQATRLLWGPDGDPSLIDSFCQNNPARLNRTDLREVASWKDALYGDFVVCRSGTDVVFATGDVGFCVRGNVAEIDEMLSAPCCIMNCALLPFDGLITFSLAFAASECDYLSEEVAQEGVQRMRASRRLARNARDWQRLAPRARALIDGQPMHMAGILMFLMDRRYESHAIDGEREEAIELVRELALSPVAYMNLIDDQCLSGPATQGLEAALLEVNDRILRGFAQPYLKSGEVVTHRTLARLAAKGVTEDPHFLVHMAIARSETAFDQVYGLIECGGMRAVPEDDLDALYAMPAILVPLLLPYHEEGRYVLAMPHEVRVALEGVDWEAARRASDAIHDASDLLTAAVDYCGVVDIEDATKTLLDPQKTGLAFEEAIDILEGRLDSNPGLFVTIYHRGRHLLVDERLTCDFDEGSGFRVADVDAVEDLLETRSGISARPMDEPPATTVHLYLEGLDSWKVLARRIDELLGVTAEDTSCTEAALLSFDHECGLSDDVVETFFETLDHAAADAGLTVTDADRRDLEPAVRAFADDVPLWQLNGWSAADLKDA